MDKKDKIKEITKNEQKIAAHSYMVDVTSKDVLKAFKKPAFGDKRKYFESK